MRIIRPTVITDALLISSNVLETAPAAYNAATTYALDDQASVAGAAGLVTVYRSLQAANTGHTPADSPTWWESVSTTYQVWASGTTYALGDRAINTTTHKIYVSIQAGNLNHDPVADTALATPLWWKVVSATAKWQMFDGLAGAQTEHAGSITVELAPGRINSVALINLDADSVTVELKDGANTIYSKTVSLQLENVFSWYDYFFEPIVRKTDISFTDLPVYGTAHLFVTITAGGTARCGELVAGMYRDIGDLMWSARAGIVDYSRKNIDPDGNPTLAPRGYSKRLNCDLHVKTALIDETHRLLTEYRATPLVWIGTNLFSSTIIFGYYRDFETIIEGSVSSQCSLQIEGLI